MSSSTSDKDDRSASATSRSEGDVKSDNSQDENRVEELDEVTADPPTPENEDTEIESRVQATSDTDQNDTNNGSPINSKMLPLSMANENQSSLFKPDENVQNEFPETTVSERLSIENQNNFYPVSSPESQHAELGAYLSNEDQPSSSTAVRGENYDRDGDRSMEPIARHQLMRHLTRAELMNQPGTSKDISPALARRLRDFRFAQKKRNERYGKQSPFGIIGLYDHLSGIRTDVEWAEDAAWRRENEEPYLSWSDFEAAKDTGLNQPFFHLHSDVCLHSVFDCINWNKQVANCSTA